MNLPAPYRWRFWEALSPAALAHIEHAIETHLDACGTHTPQVRVELENLASDIRSSLQHLVAERKAALPDPLLE